MDRPLQHVLRAVNLSPPRVDFLYVSLQSSRHSVYTIVTNNNHAMISFSGKRLGMVDIVQK